MGFSGGRKPGEGISSPTKCGVYIRLLSEAWPQEESGTKKETGKKEKAKGGKKIIGRLGSARVTPVQ